jgi:hypothetical protein
MAFTLVLWGTIGLGLSVAVTLNGLDVAKTTPVTEPSGSRRRRTKV